MFRSIYLPIQIYPLVMTNRAIENCHLQWIYPLKMVIFNGYVNLPEDNPLMKHPPEAIL